MESTNEENQANLPDGGKANEKQEENQSGGEVDVPKTEQVASVAENSELDNEEPTVGAALPSAQQENAQETSTENLEPTETEIPISSSQNENMNAHSIDSSQLEQTEGKHFSYFFRHK